MIDVKGLLRMAYYACLNGNITSNGNPVVVAGTIDLISDTAKTYVILRSGSSNTNNTHQSFTSVEQFEIDIVSRGTRVSALVVDQVASQILNLVCPIPQQNGLPLMPGIVIQDVRVTDDRYLPFRSSGSVNVQRRIIAFTQDVTESASGTAPIPNIPGLFKSPITSPDFSNSTDYNNPVLLTFDYFVFLNDASVYLLLDTQYHKLPGGGFAIDIPGFDATSKDYTIYIIPK